MSLGVKEKKEERGKTGVYLLENTVNRRGGGNIS
jgi:hypothetical protein